MAHAISVAERRARLGRRHRLAASARVDDDVAAIAKSVVVLHASDPATVVLSAVARMAHPDPAAVERALYDDRTVVRMHGMRRTLFTVASTDAALVQRSSTDAVAAVERRKLVALLEEKGVTNDAATWLEGVEARTLAAIDELGQAFATDLTKRVPELAIQIPIAEGKRYAGTVGVSSRVLFLLAAEGRLVRTRPRGGWTTSQHRWARLDDWLGAPLTAIAAAQARSCLVRRWLDRFGPGTVDDLKWWTGWSLGLTREALAELDLVDVDLDGTLAVALAEDVGPTPAPEPWVALLPGLDPTTMGWKERDWYLGEHKAQVFDRNGNAGPTVWADGRVVGGWAQRKSGEVVHRLLEDIGEERTAMVAEEAARLEELLSDARVTPRFPTPLDQELSR